MSDRVYALCATGNGLEVVKLILDELPVTGVIGLDGRQPTDAISGLVDAEAFCRQRDLEFIGVRSYELSHEADRRRLEDLPIDVLLAVGWQRLVPAWLIEHSRICGIGVHGSAGGITAGRGRSPQNWALILGCTSFSVSIFLLDPGIDSGDVIDTREFTLTPDDDIRTSHYKVAMATADMLITNWSNGRIRRREASPQPTDARYLPQRKPEDSGIDWSLPTRRVHDFVRGLTRPYPGAQTQMGDGVVKVWRGRPFPVPPGAGGVPGQVLLVLEAGELLVRTGDGAYLVDDWEARECPEGHVGEGTVLESVCAVSQMRRIIERHQAKYPELPLADEILNYAETVGARPRS